MRKTYSNQWHVSFAKSEEGVSENSEAGLGSAFEVEDTTHGS